MARSDLLDSISLYAITHESAPLEVIGGLEPISSRVYESLRGLVEGVVVLATCNRFEVYVDAINHVDVAAVLADVLGEAWSYTFRLQGVEAVRHLFEVASGLKSQILGEYEILGQVRRAWLKARAEGYTSELLDKVFHRAILAGRRAREETRISYGVVGYPQAAVELLSRALGDLNGKKLLIIGAGQAAEAAVRYLCSRYKPQLVVIANRTVEKAVKLAELCENSLAVGLDERRSFLGEVDGVLVAISGGVRVLDRADIESSGITVVDLSIPGAVERVEGRTYTVDDVRRLSEENLALRASEVGKVRAIIEEEIAKLYGDIAEFKAKTIISDIMRAASSLYEREVSRALKLHKNGGPLEPILRVTLNSYMKKVLRPLLLYIRDKVRSGDERVAEEIRSYFVRELGGDGS